MKRIIPKVGTKFNYYTVISEPYVFNKLWYVDVRCACGKTKRQPTGSLKKLSCCKKCNAKTKYRKYKKGDKKYHLTVVDYIDSIDHNHTQIAVRCDCGHLGNISSYHFGKIKSCKQCFYAKRGVQHPSYKGTKYITGTYFSQIKLNAKLRNLKFNLNINFLDKLLQSQNLKCYLSGQPISLHEHTASLDRIDSTKGYEPNNIAWIHKDIQRMKSDFDLSYFQKTCSMIHKQLLNNKIYEKT